MAYDQATRNAVRADYIYKNLTLKDCALLHDVPYNTVRAWKSKAEESGDNWDTARNAARMANGGMGDLTNKLIENFALQSEALMEKLNDTNTPVSASEQVDIMAKLSDTYSKLVASAAKSGSKVAPLAVAMSVVEILTDFIKQEYPQHINTFLEILEPFGQVVARELG